MLLSIVRWSVPPSIHPSDRRPAMMKPTVKVPQPILPLRRFLNFLFTIVFWFIGLENYYSTPVILSGCDIVWSIKTQSGFFLFIYLYLYQVTMSDKYKLLSDGHFI